MNFVVVRLALDVVELRGAVDLVVLGDVDRGLLRYHCDSSNVVVARLRCGRAVLVDGRAAAELCW